MPQAFGQTRSCRLACRASLLPRSRPVFLMASVAASESAKKRRTVRTVVKEERMLRQTLGSVMDEDEEDQVNFVTSELSGPKRHLARIVGKLLRKGTLELMNNKQSTEVEELEDSVERWRNMRLSHLQQMVVSFEPELEPCMAQVKALLVPTSPIRAGFAACAQRGPCRLV